jgi:membrane peptidoglycan carboxypeptidase
MSRRTKTVASIMLLAVVLLGWGFASYVFLISRDLPKQSQIRDTILGRYPTRPDAVWIPLYDINARLQQAVITWEDPTFYSHNGFNPTEIGRSLVRDIKAGAYIRGGSTITQQVAKNMYLNPEKTLRRKLREAILARRIEASLSKREILEIYLNIAEWGPNIQGAEAAAQYYFGRAASDLSWGESALMAGILQNPHLLNPRTHSEDARRKQMQVLEKLLRHGRLSEQEHFEASSGASYHTEPSSVARAGGTTASH